MRTSTWVAGNLLEFQIKEKSLLFPPINLDSDACGLRTELQHFALESRPIQHWAMMPL